MSGLKKSSMSCIRYYTGLLSDNTDAGEVKKMFEAYGEFALVKLHDIHQKRTIFKRRATKEVN